jgi:hypothetical protein
MQTRAKKQNKKKNGKDWILRALKVRNEKGRLKIHNR